MVGSRLDLSGQSKVSWRALGLVSEIIALVWRFVDKADVGKPRGPCAAWISRQRIRPVLIRIYYGDM